MKMDKEQVITLLEDLKASKVELGKELKLLGWSEVDPDPESSKATDIRRLIDDISDFESSISAHDEVKVGWTVFRLAVHAEDASKHSKIAANIWNECKKNIH